MPIGESSSPAYHHEKAKRDPHAGEGAFKQGAIGEVSIEPSEYSIGEEKGSKKLIKNDRDDREVIVDEGVESLFRGNLTLEKRSFPCGFEAGISILGINKENNYGKVTVIYH